MILNDPAQWDHAALSEVIAYRAAPKQVWDNTEIASPFHAQLAERAGLVVQASRFSRRLGDARHRASGAVRASDLGAASRTTT
jgi:hypothetical protein